MNKKLRRFVVDGLNSEITAISFVDRPAIEEAFVSLNSDEKMLTAIALEDEHKRMAFGAVLIPDRPIYRNGDFYGLDYDFELVFDKECISQLEQRYMRSLRANNWTEQHESDAEGLFTFESWTKADMDKDKSVALGLNPDLPVGTWFIGCKVDSDEVWQKVMRGDFNGFSIESFLRFDEFVNNNAEFDKDEKNDNNMTEFNDNFWDKLTSIFKEVLHSEKADVEQEAAEVEEVVEMEEETPEEKPEEPVAEEAEVVDEEATEETAEEVEAKANLEAENNELKAKVEELQSQLEQLLQKNVELAKQNEKLSAQPSAKPINAKSEKKGDVMDIIRSLHDGTYHK